MWRGQHWLKPSHKHGCHAALHRMPRSPCANMLERGARQWHATTFVSMCDGGRWRASIRSFPGRADFAFTRTVGACDLLLTALGAGCAPVGARPLCL